MTQGRASGCLCASPPLAGQPKPIAGRTGKTPAADLTVNAFPDGSTRSGEPMAQCDGAQWSACEEVGAEPSPGSSTMTSDRGFACLVRGSPPRTASAGSITSSIDRAAAFQDRWGGLALPPAPFYEGGPRILQADCPERMSEDGWPFPAGNCRVSMGYGFRIGPDGAFGIDAFRWVPLHGNTDGWVESLTLAAHARRWARTVTRIKGKAVESMDLGGFEPVPEVQGVTDTWWRGGDSLIIYGGLDEWGLHGG